MPKEQFLSYQKENHHPSQPPILDAVGSVLNALCVTKGYTWKEAYCKLIAVAGKIGQMPQYPKTIRELLHEEGFFLQAKPMSTSVYGRSLPIATEAFMTAKWSY